jgi:uncharacterized protein (DUF2267 family)
MQYDEFIERVQREGELETTDEAFEAIEAVLSTLGERIYRTEQSDMASQLPRGISELLTSRQKPENTRGDVQRFTLEEFHNRVAARMNSRHPQALRLTQVVTGVLMDAVSPGQIEDIRKELPDDFGVLFNRGS